MQRLDDDSNVYKLIGPVLVKQDQEEAKQNVQKRIDYINTELWVHCISDRHASKLLFNFADKIAPCGLRGWKNRPTPFPDRR